MINSMNWEPIHAPGSAEVGLDSSKIGLNLLKIMKGSNSPA